MSRLILGTAEFAPQGYAGYPALSATEIGSILSLAKEGGINILDTADSYDCYADLRLRAKGFCIYTKTRDWKVQLNWGDNELRGILYHYQNVEAPVELPFVHRWVNLGVSVYNKSQLPANVSRILQVPFNLENREFAECFNDYRTVFVRSVFGRGELLKKYSIKECLDFVKAYRPDGVIVGVRSTKELEDILTAWGS
jgi:hypothetical protein